MYPNFLIKRENELWASPPEQRSGNMAAICNKDTKPEKKVHSLLRAAGYRFRLHRNDLPALRN